MSLHNYRLIAGGWCVLILFLTLFWYFTLTRLAQILKENIKQSGSSQPPSNFAEIFLYVFRADYKQTRDTRLINVCDKLRKLLFAYVGALGAFIVFLVIMHPRL